MNNLKIKVLSGTKLGKHAFFVETGKHYFGFGFGNLGFSMMRFGPIHDTGANNYVRIGFIGIYFGKLSIH